MLQALSLRYKRPVAATLFYIFYLQFLAPLWVAARTPVYFRSSYVSNYLPTIANKRNAIFGNRPLKAPVRPFSASIPAGKLSGIQHYFSGGPSSPEATSFKAVGTNNLVNAFTGDFSYSIPLLDVGGYPVNLFYNGGISMEQEASWVGLGWNINPGSVSRNLRGIPDDFDGTDSLTQTQNVKPNRTWGGEASLDAELLGIKTPSVDLSLGYSYNNYLGPAIEMGAAVSVSIPIEESISAEKNAKAKVGATLGAKLSSRSGLTFSPSLNAGLPLVSSNVNLGIGLSTSYNSRTGIAALNLNAETKISYMSDKAKQDANTKEITHHYKERSAGPGIPLGASSITFAKPSYVPSLRMPMQNSYTSGKIELGLGAWGFRGSATLNGFYSESKVPKEWQKVKKPLVGFLYSDKANNDVNAVMDFNRLNDAEVTPNTQIISAPMYTYDVFSIQGEGTGGSIRAYRGDLGFMRDNVTISKDANLSIGADIAPPGHYGLNVNTVSSPTRVGGWEDNNNTLRQTMTFKPAQTGNSFENFYFRNPNEATVTNEDMLNRIGRDSLVRFALSGSDAVPRIDSKLEAFSTKSGNQVGSRIIAGNTVLKSREKRTQVTTILTAADASNVGLEKTIKSYKTGAGLFASGDNHLLYDSLLRVGSYRKKNHISEIDVLEGSGMRYVYGLPVYNVVQKDLVFSDDNLPSSTSDNIVGYDSTNYPTVNSKFMDNKSKLDGYLEIKETPAYASSFLLTGLISPDYVDVTGDGITEDDLGNSVKFNYTKSADNHRWRTPRNNTTAATAHFNEGKRTEMRDNKATITYGEREAWYLNSIESKSMMAVFTTASRSDAKGVKSALNGMINSSEDANKKLSKIDLYTKADLRANGISNATPIKTVIFYYSYGLCNGTPDASSGGKLTLDSLVFNYNGQSRSKKEKYVFDYGNKSSHKDNPGYEYNATDRWGNYKPVKDSAGHDVNPNGLTNLDYPYTAQIKDADDDITKKQNGQFAAAWSLKRILLPSGGLMDIQYEAKDYAYVQDRKACRMYSIMGLGKTTNYTTDNGLYSYGGGGTDNLYVYVKLPQALVSTDATKRKAEILAKYLTTLNQLAFKLQIKMPKGLEPLTAYAPNIADYGLCSNSTDNDIIYIKMGDLDGRSPLAKSATSFLLENLTGQAFPTYDASEVDDLGDFLHLLKGMFSQISDAFTNAENTVRGAGYARTIDLNKSFIRLADGSGFKFGGGLRVKRVSVSDSWNKMTHQYDSKYGQDYDYTTTENINGIQTTVSSGVASYEPGIGSEENPFREILSFKNQLPLASAQYGAIELPVLEGLFPSPMVGYSKVTIRSIHRKETHGDSTLRSAIGKQVSTFYTAKDYPSYAAYTPMNSMDYKKDPFFSFFNKEVINRRIISQGFLVINNDMHGKMKSQEAYSESDSKTPLSASYYSYKNTGKNGLNDNFDFVSKEDGGVIKKGNMGIDMELMTDVREFSIESNGTNVLGQVDIFFLTLLTIPIPTIYPTKSYVENKYRAVTCTKLINYHAVEDSVVVMDKGSVVSTKKIAYDAQTGSAIVSKTLNEFNDPIYNINYPAYWAYSSVSPAYQNIGLKYSNINFADGAITSGVSDQSVFESGDELYVTGRNNNTGPAPVSGTITYICNTSAGSGEGETQLAFNFPTPTTVPMRFLFGLLRGGGSNTGEGCDEFSFPSGYSCITHPAYYVDIPVGTTSYTTPYAAYPGGIRTTDPSNTNRWVCFDNVYPTTDIYVKLAYPTDIYMPSLTLTNSGITLHNLIPSTSQNCITYSKNVTKLWVLDKNKNNTALTVPSRDLIFIDSLGQPFTGDAVAFTLIRSGHRNNLNLTAGAVSAMANPIRDIGSGVRKLIIDSNSNVVSASALSYKEKWQTDRDIIFQRWYTYSMAVCAETDYPVCYNEIFDKKINPYSRGLLGNLRPYRSYTYYGNRKETEADQPTSIRQNGYIKAFDNYWYFNSNNDLVPDYSNTNWVWNSEITKVNTKGQELETHDPLDRYNASQFGYDKNLPVAITQNARYGESFALNMEDYFYEERLHDGDPFKCAYMNYVDIGSGIVNSSSVGTPAHSGQYMLSIRPGESYYLFPVDSTIKDSFNLKFGSVQPKVLTSIGGNVTTTTSLNGFIGQSGGTTDSAYAASKISFSGGGISMTISPKASSVTSGSFQTFLWNFSVSANYYIQIDNADTYTFTFGPILSDIPSGDYVSMIVDIYKVNDDGSSQALGRMYKTYGAYYTSTLYAPNTFLCKGIYLLKVVMADNLLTGYTVSPPWAPTSQPSATYSYSFSTSAANQNYKSLTSSPVCSPVTVPMPGTDSMLNPNFRLVPGKKMQFSAWIKEKCDSVVCYKPSYKNSTIVMTYYNSLQRDTIKPTGPIIDGWQKVEGVFTVPAGVEYATLLFDNSGDSTSYMDDFRIHPFNANMKTYVYDPRTLRLTAELDENNYASFYDYDEEGQLIRVKKETIQGIKTIKETRSAKQRSISDIY